MNQENKMSNKEKIDQFINYFVKEIEEIKSLKNIIAQKVLYTSIIDTLGRVRFPKGNNQKRIVQFISQFSDWEDKTRVSLPQLDLMLHHILSDQEKEVSKLFQLVRERLSGWQEGHIYRPDSDVEFNEVIKIATLEERKAVHYATYLELFFAYRHKMVHEFREPGYGVEMSSDGSTPYYHSYIDKPWQLVFPVGVFQNICIKSLENLKEFLIERNQNPYDSFEFGDMWIERDKLNPNIQYLIRDSQQLNANFYRRLDESFLWNKAITLHSVVENCDKFFEISEIKTESDKDRKKYIEALNAELHFTESHQTEGLFALMFAAFQELPHWLYLTVYQTKEIKDGIVKFVEGNIKSLTHGLLNTKKEFVQYSIYANFKVTDPEKAKNWDKNLDNLIWLLDRIGRKYLEAGEYNAYKHGLRVFTGESALFISPDNEPDKKTCLGYSKNSLSYLELKDIGEGGLTVREVTKHFNPNESLNHLFIMQRILDTIRNTRLEKLTKEKGAVQLNTFFEIEQSEFNKLST